MYVYEYECVCVWCICVYSILTLNCLSFFWERNSSTKLVECFGLSLVGILLTDTKKLLFLCITGEANCRVLNGTHAISKINAYKSLYIQHTVTHTQINTIIIYIRCLIFIIILYTWSIYTLCERVCCCGLCLVTCQMQWSTIYYHNTHCDKASSVIPCKLGGDGSVVQGSVQSCSLGIYSAIEWESKGENKREIKQEKVSKYTNTQTIIRNWCNELQLHVDLWDEVSNYPSMYGIVSHSATDTL